MVARTVFRTVVIRVGLRTVAIIVAAVESAVSHDAIRIVPHPDIILYLLSCFNKEEEKDADIQDFWSGRWYWDMIMTKEWLKIKNWYKIWEWLI